SASKAGIEGMTRTMALELAPFKINVNTVAPGPIATERFMENNPPDSPKTRAILENVPLARIGTPGDVADAAAFLVSDEASFITGQTLYVCGGLTIR
ncbi:MAG: SDR family oxidoreductase, partial [Desulfobacterales bacterium]|nr:SDR family oxidoreductase [Desulfobacterales bacterium]